MSVFASALGARFADLPRALRCFHAGAPSRRFVGEADVEHGPGMVARLGTAMGGFPPPGRDMPFAIAIGETDRGERWERDFGGHQTRSTLRHDAARGLIVEKLGLATCGLTLRVQAGVLHIDVARLWLGGVALPGPLTPRSVSREWQDAEGRFRFDIAAYLSGGGLLIRYRGHLLTQE